jgi:hypothetical protein
MRKTLTSVALLAFCVGGLVGCNNKSIELDKEKAVIFDAKRDGDIKTGGGPGGGNTGDAGTMVGKKKLPAPAGGK